MVKKEVIVLGDIEMGAGNLTDDFISDRALSELIIELSKREHPIDLILNGDTFDFLKCPHFKNNRLIYSRHITEEVSINKLNLMYHAHKKVFWSLKQYLKSSGKHLYFILGNHDFDLIHKGVQNKIKSILNAHKNVHFPGFYYHDHGIYVEHGQQYDFLNKANPKKLFLNYKKQRILNISWISFGLISKFMDLKEEHPFSERIYPRLLLFKQHRQIIRKVNIRTMNYFLKSIFYYPLRYFFDPSYTLPRELFKEFYRRLKTIHWDVDDILDVFKRVHKRTLHKNKIHVLGHVHEKIIEDKNGVVIIHPGSWRDEYDLDKETQKLTSRSKWYLQIIVPQDEENIAYQLINFPIKRKSIDFDKMINNELFYLKRAAKEENYHSPFVF